MLKKLLTGLFFTIMLASVAPSMSEAASNSTTTTTTTTKYVNITSGTLNVRTSASTKGSIETKLPKGTLVTVVSESNGWAEIKVNGKKGYVSSVYLSSKNTVVNANTGNASKVNKAISIAKSNLGVKYKFGGTSPSGFDCSGFVKYSFQKAGVTLPRTAADMQKIGKSVTSLSAGDLLFFAKNKGSKPTHVSIYIGNGQMIHSASSNGVSISSINNSYWKQRYIGAKRI